MKKNEEITKLQDGDIFYLKIENVEQKEYENRYILFQKVGSYFLGKDIFYKFRAKLTKEEKIPKNQKEIEELDYIKFDLTLWEDRFLPWSGIVSAEKTIEERSKVEFYPDEFGYLTNYIFIVGENVKKMLKTFQFLGNYNIKKPKDEFIPFDENNISFIKIKYLVNRLINSYTKYNMKNPVIYNLDYAFKVRKEAEKLNELFKKYTK